MAFEYMDVSGDAGIRAEGATLDEAFEEAALAMYGLITDLESVKEEKEKSVEVVREGMDELLVAWLNELVFVFDTIGFVGRRVRVTELDDKKVAATIKGEVFDPERHEARLSLKAATYHGLKVKEREGGGWLLEVIFDV